jgi:cob(I)alamin adenosyltransferase
LTALEAGKRRLPKMLARIQNEMFDLGADLATPPDIQFGFGPHDMALRIVPSQVARLEDEIDRMNDALDAAAKASSSPAAPKPQRGSISRAR